MQMVHTHNFVTHNFATTKWHNIVQHNSPTHNSHTHNSSTFFHTQHCHTQFVHTQPAWHLWLWAGSGGALGRPRRRVALFGRRGIWWHYCPSCVAGVALMAQFFHTQLLPRRLFHTQLFPTHLFHTKLWNLSPITLSSSTRNSFMKTLSRIALSQTTLSHAALSHTTLSHTTLWHTQLFHKQLFHTPLFHTQLFQTQLFQHTALLHTNSFRHSSFPHNSFTYSTFANLTFITLISRIHLSTFLEERAWFPCSLLKTFQTIAEAVWERQENAGKTKEMAEYRLCALVVLTKHVSLIKQHDQRRISRYCFPACAHMHVVLFDSKAAPKVALSWGLGTNFSSSSVLPPRLHSTHGRQLEREFMLYFGLVT